MGKKKKKSKAKLIKRVKKVIRQSGNEIVIGLATGIITNILTDASEKLLEGKKTAEKNK